MNNQNCGTTWNVVGRGTQKHMRGGWVGGAGQVITDRDKTNWIWNTMWTEDTQLIRIHTPSLAVCEKNVSYFVRSSASGKPHFLT